MGKNWGNVICMHDKNGTIQPLILIWDDGNKYYIDKILNAVFRPLLKSGEVGLRYTCCIQSQQRYSHF